MRIIIADCSATYEGRGSTYLPRYKRAIVFKADGSVSLHSDKSNKPLNYMGAPNVVSEEIVDGLRTLVVDSRKESLRITIHHVYVEYDEPLGDADPGLLADGTEGHLQEWIAQRPELFGEGYTLVRREYQTGAGPVDIAFEHEDGHLLIVEVKRVAMLGAVDQVVRYRNALDRDDVRGVIAALDIRPKTLIQAEKRGVETVTITWDR